MMESNGISLEQWTNVWPWFFIPLSGY